MKKILIFAIAMSAALCLSAAQKVHNAGFSAISPVLDGEILTDPAWKNVPWSGGFEKRVTAEKPVSDTRFKALYTDDALYIAAECMEEHMDRLASEHNYIEFWLCDVVEVFLIPHRNEMIHLIYSVENHANEEIPGATSVRTKNHTGWLAQSSKGKDRWNVEFCIPLYLLGVTPSEGDIAIPFNLCRNATPAKEMSSWSFQKGSFKEKLGFGKLVLKKAPAKMRDTFRKTLTRPHWISLLKRWKEIRKDPFWEDILGKNRDTVLRLDGFMADRKNLPRNAESFAEALKSLEKQSALAEEKHRKLVDRLLFED